MLGNGFATGCANGPCGGCKGWAACCCWVCCSYVGICSDRPGAADGPYGVDPGCPDDWPNPPGYWLLTGPRLPRAAVYPGRFAATSSTAGRRARKSLTGASEA